ncbi:MAG TPA: DUF1015 family protein [Verrucomicrobiales bacterium]|nr:DUF1015 family protein [Verrucomicrobiales bacterium]
MRTKAFHALVPRPGLAAQVAAVPYDVVDTEEARALAAGNPHNLLHVDRAEIDLPPGVDPYSDAVYARAKKNFAGLQRDGILQRLEEPSIFIYRQTWQDHVQTGVALACHIDDYGADVIRKHERTRPAKENDRVRLVETLNAHTGPIFLTYRDDACVDQLAENIVRTAPDVDFRDEKGVRHQVWKTPDSGAFVEAFARVSTAYVADGHHRSASAWRVGQARRKASPAHDGSEDYNWFLGVLFPASQLRILPYNRILRDLHGLSSETFLERLRERLTWKETGCKAPREAGRVCVYCGGVWNEYGFAGEIPRDPVHSLDVSLLQERVLEPLLGIGDPRTDERIDFVGGIRGTTELERKVDAGEGAAAFSLFPVTVEQLMAISDAGAIMPPKSTWFEPKLRSGLFIYTF